MKHTLATLLLCLLLLLTGCGADTASTDASGIKAVNLIADGDIFYYVDEFTGKNGLSMCSLQNGEWKTLCPDPLCTHENECILYGRRFVRGVIENGKLYYSAWNVFGAYQLQDGSTCVLGCLDLKNMQYEDFVSYDRSSLLEEFVKCGDALYYYYINADGCYDITRYDLKSKKETVLFTTDIIISSLIVEKEHIAFGTGVGLYLGDLNPQSGKLENVRLAVPMSRDFIYDDICCYLHDGYVYYSSGKYVPEGENRFSTNTGDYCRFPIDGDISQSETVVRNAYGTLFFQGSRIYSLPEDIVPVARYYYHDQQTGPEDLPENLAEISFNRGGIAYYDTETGESGLFWQKDTLFIDQICTLNEDWMLVKAFCTENVTIDEELFIKGGYRAYNQNRGYYIVSLKDQTCRMLRQEYPDQGAY